MSERLAEIKAVLLEARNTPDYNIGSPRALDHLLVHVVAIIDELMERSENQSIEISGSSPVITISILPEDGGVP